MQGRGRPDRRPCINQSSVLGRHVIRELPFSSTNTRSGFHSVYSASSTCANAANRHWVSVRLTDYRRTLARFALLFLCLQIPLRELHDHTVDVSLRELAPPVVPRKSPCPHTLLATGSPVQFSPKRRLTDSERLADCLAVAVTGSECRADLVDLDVAAALAQRQRFVSRA
jgi:hypothetical protein